MPWESIPLTESNISHSNINDLTSGDDHTQYFYNNGRSGGQTIYGGTDASDDLILSSTSHATKGETKLNDISSFGVGTNSPQAPFHLKEKDLNVTSSMAAENVYADIFVEGEDARLNLFSEREGGHGSSLVLAEMEKINNKFEFNDAWTICSASSNMYRNLMFIYGENTDYSSNDHIFHFTTDGKIGINDFTPSANLHIKETGDASIWLQADTDNIGEDDNPYLKMTQDGGEVSSIIGHCVTGKDPEGNDFTDVRDNAMLIGTTWNGGLQLGVNSAVAMTIRKDKKICVGNTYADHLFQVTSFDESDSFGGTASVKIANTATAGFGKHASLTFGPNNVDGAGIAGIYTNWNATNSVGWELGFFTKDSFSEATPQEKVRIDKKGKVGIGTTTPNEKLEVDGKIRANTSFNTNGTDGITTTFTNGDGDTVTVTGGIITSIA